MSHRRGTVQKNSWIFDFEIDPDTPRVATIRHQEFPVAKQAGTTRALFLGDSATEGAFVPDDEAFPFQFKRLLDIEYPGNNLEVINAGV